MANIDGKIVGRLLRVKESQPHANGSTTVFLTVAINRGSRKDVATGETVQNAPDYLSFQFYADGKDASRHQVELWKDLAENNVMVQVSYSLKSNTFADAEGKTVTRQFVRLDRLEILEGKTAVADRIARKGETVVAPKEDPEPADAFKAAQAAGIVDAQ